jgi:hypothetical protein
VSITASAGVLSKVTEGKYKELKYFFIVSIFRKPTQDLTKSSFILIVSGNEDEGLSTERIIGTNEESKMAELIEEDG